MATLPTLFLKPGEAERIVAGHPWIFASSLQKSTQSIPDGEVVEVRDHRRRFLGLGFYNGRSQIVVRVLTTIPERIDSAFFEKRIREAWALRQRHLPEVSSCRVVNAESDFLSGLIVDRYGDVLVVQITSLGMDRCRDTLVDVLNKVFSPRSILERSDSGARRFEGLEAAAGVLHGEPVELLTAVVGGLEYRIPWKAAHKTGLYLDQQFNQMAVGQFARGGDVLDTFTFIGGFALQAAHQGAKSVIGIDQSLEAVTAARLNAERNGLSKIARFEVGNVFDWLKAQTVDDRRVTPPESLGRFDLIILDPPSFTRTRAAVPNAMRGYKEIHLRALKLLRPGGVLATFCCSHHVPASLFEEAVLDAAFDCRRVLRRVASYQQSLDHPVVPSIPETQYLKGFAYEIAH
jgi:23S rRNA (cytosine1962-C5)-methyltransferase